MLFRHSATEMLAMLARGDVTARALVDAHLARIDAVDGGLRSIVHRFDGVARREADAIDAARRRGEKLGPLAGLPITIKESIATAGTAVTLGVPSKRGEVVMEDAVMVKLLRAAGAIVIAKTNVSQLLLFHECENPIFGVTSNPFAKDRVPGGSSGGESAAIAAGLSPFGLGGDIGGSIRVPAAFCGIAGLKPTADRWSNFGSGTALKGQELVRGQCGPMARSAQDLATVMSAIDVAAIAAEDPAVPAMALGSLDPALASKLTVGVYEDDGFLAASPAVMRGVRRAAEVLRASGVKVVPFAPPSVGEMMEAYFGALSSDGGATVEAALSGGEVSPQLARLRSTVKLPGPVRALMATALSLKGQHRLARLIRQVHEKSVAEYWRRTHQRTLFRKQTADAWRAAGIDAVICPVHATMALRHRDATNFSVGGFYSMMYNLLNFPAGSVPVGVVREDDAPRSSSRDELDAIARTIEAGAVGLPLGVQVVAPPWRDERVLILMQAIERGLGSEAPKTPIDPR